MLTGRPMHWKMCISAGTGLSRYRQMRVVNNEPEEIPTPEEEAVLGALEGTMPETSEAG